MGRSLIKTLILILIVGLCQSVSAGTETPTDLAGAYLQAVLHEDWPTARALWSAGDLSASRRLGIRYTDHPFKLDSASLLVLERDRCRTGEIHVEIGAVEAVGATARIQYTLTIGAESATVGYTAFKSDEGWRFVKATTALCADWTHRRTEFIDLRIHPDRTISDTALQKLDQFVAETCTRLAISPSRVDQLRENKLGYVLGVESAVTEIVGVPTVGIALLQTDVIVTSEPCHLHELAHLLVNFALQDLPLYTLPFMQEGAAVALGGRWGRAPEVLHPLGRFTLAEDFLTLDELLTWGGFHTYGPDLTYATSGVLADYLLGVLGGEAYLTLYRDLSGSLPTLQRYDQTTVKTHIGMAAGREWPELAADFEDYLSGLSCGGFFESDEGEGEVFVHMKADSLVITACADGPWLRWIVEADRIPARGALLLGGSEYSNASRLFSEQFPQRPYAGERLGLVFSPEEIGLYDFHTDLLVAKHVASFCPETVIASEDGTRLAFKIRRELLPTGDWNPVLICN